MVVLSRFYRNVGAGALKDFTQPERQQFYAKCQEESPGQGYEWRTVKSVLISRMVTRQLLSWRAKATEALAFHEQVKDTGVPLKELGFTKDDLKERARCWADIQKEVRKEMKERKAAAEAAVRGRRQRMGQVGLADPRARQRPRPLAGPSRSADASRANRQTLDALCRAVLVQDDVYI